jgi:photosystem II stability/assembly factor-like uncharacterized protein
MSSNWKQVNASGIGDVAVAPNGRLWMAGQNGTVWYSDDQGVTSHQITGSGFSRVANGPDGVLWGVGINGTLWSWNSALVWEQSKAVTNATDVTVAPNGTVWITRTDGTIHYSTDKGQTFTAIVASGFLHISAGSDNVLWAVGINGTLWYYQSASGKPAWKQTAASDMRDVGVELSSMSSNQHLGRIWLAGKNGTVWLSIDNGVTFTQKTDASGFASIAGAGSQSKVSSNPEDAWAVGTNGTVWCRFAGADYLPATGTKHFSIQYDSALGGSGRMLAERLTWVIEGIYQKLSTLFGGIDPGATPILLSIDALPNGGSSSTASIDIHTMSDIEEARYVFVSELAEVFMRAQKNGGWNPNDSKGEALSRLLGAEAFPLFPAGYLSASNWLNSPRIDYVSANFADDKDFPSFGCAILFLNYLHYQLGYGLDAIIGDRSPTLSGIYKNLTGKTDAFQAFSALMTRHFPLGTPVNLKNDNPFPLS